MIKTKLDELKVGMFIMAMDSRERISSLVCDTVESSRRFLSLSDKEELIELIDSKNSGLAETMSKVTTAILDSFDEKVKPLAMTIDRNVDDLKMLYGLVKSIKRREDDLTIVLYAKKDVSSLIIEDSLLVREYFNDVKKNRQMSVFKLFLDGMLQTNDHPDNGDYSLSLSKEKDTISINFYDDIEAGSQIVIFAVKA
jgi:hypothetical protein